MSGRSSQAWPLVHPLICALHVFPSASASAMPQCHPSVKPWKPNGETSWIAADCMPLAMQTVLLRLCFKYIGIFMPFHVWCWSQVSGAAAKVGHHDGPFEGSGLSWESWLQDGGTCYRDRALSQASAAVCQHNAQQGQALWSSNSPHRIPNTLSRINTGDVLKDDWTRLHNTALGLRL